MPHIRQTNFLGGELSPLLWGRTDLPVFGTGLRRMRNFFASRHGAAVSRPGTTFVGFQKYLSPARLIPFVYSDTQSYVLEVGLSGTQLYVRFYTNGEVLETVPGSGVPYEVTLSGVPTTASLTKLRWAQSGDVLFLAGEGWGSDSFVGPFELRRYPNVAGTDAPDWRFSSTEFTAGDPHFPGGQPTLVSPLPAADSTHPEREWKWMYSQTVRDNSTGRTFETVAQDVYLSSTWSSSTVPLATTAASTNITLYPDKPVTIRECSLAPVYGDTDFTPIATNFYRGRGKLFGFVGQTTSNQFIDTGFLPDYAMQPLRGTNPFRYTNNSGTHYETPRTVTFFQERLIYSGTDLRPATILASATGNYSDFDKHTIPIATEALEYEIAARRRENIIHAVSSTHLLLWSNSSVWTAAGQQGYPLGIDAPDVRMVDEVGATDLPPIIVDGTPIWARTKGVGVRALIAGQDGFTGQDISFAAQHLFTGYVTTTEPAYGGSQETPATLSSKLVDWCYAEDPWGVVWAAREDGALLSLTYQPGQSAAWALHSTQGRVVSLCSVPEGGEDAVYMIVVRSTANDSQSTSIERMASRLRRDTVDDDCCLDCAVKVTMAPGLVVSGLDHLVGLDVWVTAKDNPTWGPLTVTEAGTVTLPEVPAANDGSNVVLYAGLTYTPEIETLDIAQGEARARQKTVTHIGFEVDDSRGLFVGQDFDNITEWQQRDVSDSYSPPSAASAYVRQPVMGTWDSSARGVLRQTLPYPVTVLAFVREVDFGS